MSDPVGWAIMPVLGAPDLTEAALGDLLSQSVPLRVLIINQGVDTAFREHLEQLAEQEPDRLLVWHHQPSLPSLSATWNRALRFVWACGGTEALVVNNDVRLHPETLAYLHDGIMLRAQLGHPRPCFVSAVGVTAAQFADFAYDVTSYGGPDFSCFLLAKEGHDRYPFDERFVPAYCEDLDLHRRYMLGGDADRIFSINLPYLHVGGGSGTLKSFTPDQRAAHEARIGQSRRYYESKWGGPVNAERWTIPFDPDSDQDGVTTPDLQRTI